MLSRSFKRTLGHFGDKLLARAAEFKRIYTTHLTESTKNKPKFHNSKNDFLTTKCHMASDRSRQDLSNEPFDILVRKCKRERQNLNVFMPPT